MSSPTQRSKAKLTKAGYLVGITERWNRFAMVRQDLYGFIDMLAIRGDEVLAVQTTSAGNVSSRVAKIKSLPAAAIWLSSPYRKIVVHGWALRGKRGERKRWECREVNL